MTVLAFSDEMSIPRGVGAVVTNRQRTRFFVQQKDAEYPDYPLGYSFFGGGVEGEEQPRAALERELVEELGRAATLLPQPTVPVVDSILEPPGVHYYLFELEVEDTVLDRLAEAEVFEGERGVVVCRSELLELAFIWGLGRIVRMYLDAVVAV